jgi:hypothetical protein
VNSELIARQTSLFAGIGWNADRTDRNRDYLVGRFNQTWPGYAEYFGQNQLAREYKSFKKVSKRYKLSRQSWKHDKKSEAGRNATHARAVWITEVGFLNPILVLRH